MIFLENSPVWPVTQQILVRAATASKFFLLAKILGPSAVGLVAAALTISAIVDALSDFGLNQAAIQQKNEPSNRMVGALWSAITLRGIALGFGLYVTSSLTSSWIGVPAAAALVNILAIDLVVRGIIQPRYFLLQRSTKFRTIFLIEFSCILIDIFTAIFLAYAGYGAVAIPIGVLAASSFKLLVSWILFFFDIEININFSNIKSISSYGGWLWLNSILISFVNQLDKILIGRLLGEEGLGIYQVTMKLAQLATTDLGTAFSGYLYPKMSVIYHSSKCDVNIFFISFIRRIFPFFIIWCVFFAFSAPYIFGLIFDNKWNSSKDLIPFALVPSIIGFLLMICASYMKAIGAARLIVPVVLVQIIFLIIFTYTVVPYYGVIGMMVSNTLSGVMGLIVLMYLVKKIKNS